MHYQQFSKKESHTVSEFIIAIFIEKNYFKLNF